jgi:5,5'-dehydrodivanillate O-demethylase
MDAVARGEDPKGLLRDPACNNNVDLPDGSGKLRDGMTLEQMRADPILSRSLQDFVFNYGQPPEVRRAFEEAMGLR